MVWRESSDYAAYFCGLDCFEQWRSDADRARLDQPAGRS
jgi:hypothetical protein